MLVDVGPTYHIIRLCRTPTGVCDLGKLGKLIDPYRTEVNTPANMRRWLFTVGPTS